jgi:hypothetical protein
MTSDASTVQIDPNPRTAALCALVQFLESLPDEDDELAMPVSTCDDQRKPVIPHAMGQRAGHRPPVRERAA